MPRAARVRSGRHCGGGREVDGVRGTVGARGGDGDVTAWSPDGADRARPRTGCPRNVPTSGSTTRRTPRRTARRWWSRVSVVRCPDDGRDPDAQPGMVRDEGLSDNGIVETENLEAHDPLASGMPRSCWQRDSEGGERLVQVSKVGSGRVGSRRRHRLDHGVRVGDRHAQGCHDRMTPEEVMSEEGPAAGGPACATCLVCLSEGDTFVESERVLPRATSAAQDLVRTDCPATRIGGLTAALVGPSYRSVATMSRLDPGGRDRHSWPARRSCATSSSGGHSGCEVVST